MKKEDDELQLEARAAAILMNVDRTKQQAFIDGYITCYKIHFMKLEPNKSKE
jgi:hypothetical protein